MELEPAKDSNARERVKGITPGIYHERFTPHRILTRQNALKTGIDPDAEEPTVAGPPDSGMAQFYAFFR